jgi:hypothetical protein
MDPIMLRMRNAPTVDPLAAVLIVGTLYIGADAGRACRWA